MSATSPAWCSKKCLARCTPYVVLAIEDALPDSENARQDHVSVFRQALAVHSLASATEEEGSEIVYRRALRMGEAVHLVMSRNMTCKRLLRGNAEPDTGSILNPVDVPYERP
jgi:hypothetical protein